MWVIALCRMSTVRSIKRLDCRSLTLAKLKETKTTKTMALSLRAKNLLLGGSLATFAGSVFAYTVMQMNKVRVRIHAVVVTVAQLS